MVEEEVGFIRGSDEPHRWKASEDYTIEPPPSKPEIQKEGSYDMLDALVEEESDSELSADDAFNDLFSPKPNQSDREESVEIVEDENETQMQSLLGGGRAEKREFFEPVVRKDTSKDLVSLLRISIVLNVILVLALAIGAYFHFQSLQTTSFNNIPPIPEAVETYQVPKPPQITPLSVATTTSSTTTTTSTTTTPKPAVEAPAIPDNSAQSFSDESGVRSFLQSFPNNMPSVEMGGKDRAVVREEAKNYMPITEVSGDFIGERITAKMYTHDPAIDKIISSVLQRRKWFGMPISTWIMRHVLPERPNVFELGCNIGSILIPTAMYIQKLGGEHLGVDADPMNYALAANNIEVNNLDNAVAIHRAIVQDPTAIESVELVDNVKNKGDTQLLPDGNKSTVQDKVVRVETVNVDGLFRSNPEWFCNVSVWKLDIQGYEGQAFLSSEQWLGQCPPCYIIFEVHEVFWKANGTPLNESIAFMRSKGYDMYLDGKLYTEDDYHGSDQDFVYSHQSCVNKDHKPHL